LLCDEDVGGTRNKYVEIRNAYKNVLQKPEETILESYAQRREQCNTKINK
jgi:hypothetical protein